MMIRSMFSSVESEVARMWQANREAQSSVMQALLPVEPPREFWVAQYYGALAAIVAKVPSGLSASSSSAPDVSVVSASGSCGLVPAGAAQGVSGIPGSRCDQHHTAGLVGTQAFMDDTAYERPAAVFFKDADLQFVGSRSLLSDAEPGSHVHSQGKVVYYNPESIAVTPQTQSGR